MSRYVSFLIALPLLCIGVSLQAMQPLEVVYPEDDGPVVESQQLYIDNQAYLREFERRRTARLLDDSGGAPVAVIRKKSVRSFTPFSYPFYQDYTSNEYLGVEVRGGGTVIRYVDGYQPNCCVPFYNVRPRPPVAVPYQGSSPPGH